MNDAQRYRMNAAQCRTAAEPRESPYRRLAFAIAAYASPYDARWASPIPCRGIARIGFQLTTFGPVVGQSEYVV